MVIFHSYVSLPEAIRLCKWRLNSLWKIRPFPHGSPGAAQPLKSSESFLSSTPQLIATDNPGLVSFCWLIRGSPTKSEKWFQIYIYIYLLKISRKHLSKNAEFALSLDIYWSTNWSDPWHHWKIWMWLKTVNRTSGALPNWFRSYSHPFLSHPPPSMVLPLNGDHAKHRFSPGKYYSIYIYI
jgi:hypothetical protein